jgi:hypothetical protein
VYTVNLQKIRAAQATALAAAMLLVGIDTHAADYTAPYTASYTVSNNGTRAGVMTRSLSAGPDGTYVLESQLIATEGLMALIGIKVTERSKWDIKDGEIRPLDYLYRQSGLSSRKISMEFDWPNKLIHAKVKGEKRELDIVPGMYDNLLYQIAISRDLKAGKQTLDYVVAESGKIKKYHIVQAGHDKLETPLGTLDTIKLEKHNPGSKRQTTLWCAPSLNYLPVRMDHIEKNGEETSAVIRSYNPAAAP